MNRHVIKRQPTLEVIAVDAADAQAAEQGGADRIELVSAMSEGGLTPSYGQIEQVVSKVSIPVYVMIRPHSRSFCYSVDDLHAIIQDIRVARELGAAGIVIGVLTNEGEVDRSFLQTCLLSAQGMGVTFHRAIDSSAHVVRALESIGSVNGGNEGKGRYEYEREMKNKSESVSESKNRSSSKSNSKDKCECESKSEESVVERVLTSGGKLTAPEGLLELQQLQEIGQTLNISIMAGSGITIEGIPTIVSRTGITEIHMGSGVRHRGSFDHPVDAQLVAQAKAMLIRSVQELQ
ncbi:MULTISPECIES: copper homeostasis protein CutC [Paenibacillus]|uniref:PF03932 family protein CutC n=1 Tax=Paenibacillus cucumis (ex Kampfer et al. 2016) TaxID=1776858 RepID=A0ABS7KNE3_9BACL|nr:copper homeostasis protein CutC [Paenibacillus cucumis (ex Kampfer et al. 2016)]MBY0205690.1 copper homeostasis protein CutC [Paenibacillus cucumis (ex Kampfer et al. 2016)]MDP9701996.1 copper homeostasis protein [Paenibacillus intestini]